MLNGPAQWLNSMNRLCRKDCCGKMDRRWCTVGTHRDTETDVQTRTDAHIQTHNTVSYYDKGGMRHYVIIIIKIYI